MSNIQTNPINGKQVKMMLGALAVAFFGFINAQPAQARVAFNDDETQVSRTRTRETTRQQQALDNPCVPADGTILLDTVLRTEFESKQQGDRFRSNFKTNERGSGKSTVTNAPYRYDAMSENRFESDVNTFETRFESRQLLNRIGPKPAGIKKTDFFVRTRTREKVTQGEFGEQTIEDQRSESGCK